MRIQPFPSRRHLCFYWCLSASKIFSLLQSEIFTKAQNVEFETLDSILLYDILPPSSPRCRHTKASSTQEENVGQTLEKSFFSFEHSLSSSQWYGESGDLEPFLFQAEMHHDDPDPARTWTLRVGQGGNIYSFRGAYGEAIPPQEPFGAAFVDEVWQMVSVNQIHNRDSNLPPYFIHQAGVYMNQKELNNKHFYSPSIARHCETKNDIWQCSFGSWGQQANIPSIFQSHTLYFNRYQDCGDGVIEVTSVIQNIAPHKNGGPSGDVPETLSYLNVPWAGVRTSTLQNLLLSDPSGRLHLQHPLQFFGSEQTIPDLKETGGFTTFTQNLKLSNHGFDPDQYELPEAGENGQALPHHQAKKKRKKRIQQKKAMEASRLARIVQLPLGQNGTKFCQDDNTKTNQLSSANNILGTSNDVQENDEIEKELRLIVKSNKACSESPGHTDHFGRRILRIMIKSTVEIKTGERVCNLYFRNSRTGEQFVVMFILHWSWGGDSIYFSPADDHVTADYVNARFREWDEVQVAYAETGKEDQDNLALTFVHGVGAENDGYSKSKTRLPSRLRFGATHWRRQFTVFTINIRKAIDAGDTYVNRQYIITDKFLGTKERAATWVSETFQDLIPAGEHRAREIQLLSSLDGNTFGASFEGQVCERKGRIACTGVSTPKPGLNAHFYIKCGDMRYVGSDRYIFSESHNPSEKAAFRSYSCKGDLSLRPQYKLIGYFKDGSCDNLIGLEFEPKFCAAPSYEQDKRKSIGKGDYRPSFRSEEL